MTTSSPASSPLHRPAMLRFFAIQVDRYELGGLALSAPFLMFPNRLTGLAAVGLGLVWGCRWWVRSAPSVRTPLDWPIVLLSLMTAVGMWASIDLPTSWPKLWGILLGIAVYYGVANAAAKARNGRAVVSAVCLALLLASVGAAGLSLVVTDWQVNPVYDTTWVTDHIPRVRELAARLPTGGVPRDVSGGAWERSDCCDTNVLLHPRMVGGTMAMLVPFALGVALSGLKGGYARGTRLLAALALGVCSVVLYLSQSVSSNAGVLVAVPLVLLARFGGRRSSWVVVLALLGALALPAIALAGLGGTAASLLNPQGFVGDSLIERMRIWTWAAEAIRNQPITGVGLNSLDYTVVGLYPVSQMYDIYHAHNLLLQVGADLGLPGLLAFLWLLAAFGVTVVRAATGAATGRDRVLPVAAGAGVLAYVLFGSFDTITLGAKPGVILWALLGLGLAASGQLHRPGATGARLSRPVLLGAVALVVGAMATLVVTLPGVLALNFGTLEAHKALVNARLKPEAPQRDQLAQAAGLLSFAVQNGQATEHSYALLTSLHGWLGDCDQTISYARQAIAVGGGDYPLGQGFWAKLTSPARADSVGRQRGVVATLLGSTADGSPGGLLYRLGIPREPRILVERYTHVRQSLISRWGPGSNWWEPYLLQAMVLDEQLGAREAAEKVIEDGLARVDFPGPLSCYLHASSLRNPFRDDQ